MTAESLSKKNIVSVIEVKTSTDINIDIHLNNNSIFVTPDEGKSNDEQVIWSRDELYFMLVGKGFYVLDNCPQINNLDCYFLFSLKDKKVYCNSSQYEGEGFNQDMIDNINWMRNP